MAIVRLLSPKLTPHFTNRRGFVALRRRRWLSSSPEDGRSNDKLPDSKYSASNKYIGQKGMHWYSAGGVVANLKEKISGYMLLFNKTKAEEEDSVTPKPPILTVTKDVSLQNVSEMGSQDSSQSIAGVEIPLDTEFTNAKRVDLPTSENQGKFQSDQKKTPPNKLGNSNFSMPRRESCNDVDDPHSILHKMLSDPVEKQTDAPQNPAALLSVLVRNQKSGDLPTNNGGEGNSVPKKKEESKGKTLVMQNQSKSLDPCNKLLLRFLRERVDKSKIVTMLYKYGDVLDVQDIPSFQGCIYKDALVTFKTNSAAKTVLDKAYLAMECHNVIIEATSQEDIVEKVRIPNLIGDPDVPIALVKRPTRTVKIHPLTNNISSNQIKEALRFCGSDISKVIFGSSKTPVFVEFETEDGKDKAIAAHSISIFNKRLFISRIDTPRTTVVRISNVTRIAMKEVGKVCGTYGQISQVVHRGMGVVDVRFKVSEWPNMLNILNSLNGKEVDGVKWLVQPATMVIPPEILKVLWEDPKEKRYVKSLIRNSVGEIEKPLDVTLVEDLVL